MLDPRSYRCILSTCVHVTILLLCVLAEHKLLHAEVVVQSINDVGGWVLQESTGRAFASLRSEGVVVEYSPSGEVRRWSVGRVPTELMVKGQTLIVACTTTPELRFIDLKTNSEVAQLELAGKGPYALFCSKAADPYVYCICNTGDAWWDGEVFQIDMRTREVRKRTKVKPWRQRHPVHVAMSPDGKWIIPDAIGQSSSSGADLMNVNAEDLTFLQVNHQSHLSGQIVAGPLNRHWALGSDLYSLDLQRKIRTFSGSSCAIHPNLDLVASLRSNDTLFLQRYRDAAVIAQETLTFQPPIDKEQTEEPNRQQGVASFEPTLQFDLANNRLFVGVEHGCAWVDLSGIQQKLQPLEMINAPSEVNMLVNRPMSIPISVTNPSTLKTAKIVIAQGPVGAKIVDNRIVWQPTSSDLGTKSVTLDLKAEDGRELDSVQIELVVKLPKISLDFHIHGMRLSAGGKRLVAWGPVIGGEKGSSPLSGFDGIAVIDTEEIAVVAAKSIPKGIHAATISDDYVIIAPKSGNLVYRLDHRLSNAKRRFLQSAPRQLAMLSPYNLLVRGEEVEIFDIRKMTAIHQGIENDFFRSDPFVEDETVRWQGRVTDRLTGKLLHLTQVNLPTTAPKPEKPHFRTRHTEPIPSRGWGRKMRSYGSLGNTEGSLIYQAPEVQAAVISRAWPLGIMISQKETDGVITSKLLYCNLIDGTILQTSIVSEMADGIYRSLGKYPPLLLARSESLYFANDTELLFAPLPRHLRDLLPTPVHFTDQQVTEIAVGGRQRVPLGVGGNRNGTKFSLLKENYYVKIDENTGTLTVDTDSLWKHILAMAIARSRNGVTLDLKENAKQYFIATGKKLDEHKFAGGLPISVKLRDSEGQEDRINFAIVLTGPNKFLTDQIEKNLRAEQIRRKQQASQEAAINRQVLQGMSAEQRVKELETRIRRVEAVLDGILREVGLDTGY